VMGSTNNVMVIDTAIKDRFGDPFKFNPLTVEQRRFVLKRKMLDVFEGDAKKSFEIADDDEWDTLAQLIPQGKSIRYIVVDLFPSVRSRVGRLQGEEGRTDPISLQDFIEHLNNKPSDTVTSESTTGIVAQSIVVEHLKNVFEVAPYSYEIVLPLPAFVKRFLKYTQGFAIWTFEAMDAGNDKTFLDIVANNKNCTKEFRNTLTAILNEAFPETCAGPLGPALTDSHTRDKISAYDTNWRNYYQCLPHPDTLLVTLKNGHNAERGDKDKGYAHKCRDWIINLRVKERFCCGAWFYGTSFCPKCEEEVSRKSRELHKPMEENYYDTHPLPDQDARNLAYVMGD